MPFDVLLFASRVVIALLLYGFVGVLFYYMLKDLRSIEQADEQSTAQTPKLRVTHSEITPVSPGDSYSLRPRTRLGRAATCDIVLVDTFVSLEHAIIQQRDNQWWLSDHNSRNGTLINDVTVEDDVILAPGDEITIGRVTLVFEYP